ncbi:hypothetical protein P7K49_006551 [Saguinus oedipus]|uniref:Secreted protein n=1 Tax=Saguinus oedipus TaxID=9490 RepID=A0ABQ9W2R4_SAGOE|nr:hypothetical protein P7K49_006551 [Saguinus oedipus]
MASVANFLPVLGTSRATHLSPAFLSSWFFSHPLAPCNSTLLSSSILRYTISLNVTWLVNSAAHMYGNRPYDKHISPRQNPLVTLGAIGE